MNSPTYAQHDLPVSFLDDDDEGYIVYVDDESDVSTLSCSVVEQSPSMKRSRKSMDLSSIFHSSCQDDRSHKRRRRGASYTIMEIRSLLHLMKRVLPKTPDEWEFTRMVHCRIFPDNDRTVQSLKKKFRDLCRNYNHGPNALDERFRAQPVHGKKEVEKAREVQHLISLKPPGFQLILPKSTNNKIEVVNSDPNNIPEFKVRVPNPLEPVTTAAIEQQVPQYVQIPESPLTTTTTPPSNEQDNLSHMSDLDLDEIDQLDDDDKESVILSPIIPIGAMPVLSRGIPNRNKKIPVIICDQK